MSRLLCPSLPLSWYQCIRGCRQWELSGLFCLKLLPVFSPYFRSLHCILQVPQIWDIARDLFQWGCAVDFRHSWFLGLFSAHSKASSSLSLSPHISPSFQIHLSLLCTLIFQCANLFLSLASGDSTIREECSEEASWVFPYFEVIRALRMVIWATV